MTQNHFPLPRTSSEKNKKYKKKTRLLSALSKQQNKIYSSLKTKQKISTTKKKQWLQKYYL